MCQNIENSTLPCFFYAFQFCSLLEEHFKINDIRKCKISKYNKANLDIGLV